MVDILFVVVVVIVLAVVIVFVDPRNLPLKFGQNRFNNSWGIADIEFAVGGGGGCGGGVQSDFFCQTQL